MLNNVSDWCLSTSILNNSKHAFFYIRWIGKMFLQRIVFTKENNVFNYTSCIVSTLFWGHFENKHKTNYIWTMLITAPVLGVPTRKHHECPKNWIDFMSNCFPFWEMDGCSSCTRNCLIYSAIGFSCVPTIFQNPCCCCRLLRKQKENT